MKIENIKEIAKEAWIESFFTKRHTDITGFEDWWKEHEAKFLEQERMMKASIRYMLNSTVGTKDMSIEAGAKRYWDNIPMEMNLVDEENWQKAFTDGAKSPEAREMWYRDFLTNTDLKS